MPTKTAKLFKEYNVNSMSTERSYTMVTSSQVKYFIHNISLEPKYKLSVVVIKVATEVKSIIVDTSNTESIEVILNPYILTISTNCNTSSICNIFT